MLRVTVLGTGYVGLVSGICLADLGHQVIYVDRDSQKISVLKNQKIPIYEPDLEGLLQKNIKQDRLKFSTRLDDSLNKSDVIIIAVEVPIANKTTGEVNLSYVNEYISEIVESLSKDVVIIVQSTVPVGSCDEIQTQLNKLTKFKTIVISNPSFLRKGNAVEDFMNPQRIVIGSDGSGREIIEQLFWQFIRYGKRFIFCDRRTAELIKYAANTFLAMKLEFINEIADISKAIDGDLEKLIIGIGSDKRIGSQFLNPSPGFGGSCFSKDIQVLTNLISKKQIDASLIRSILESNSNRFKTIAKEIISNTTKSDIITILGVTYKAGTEDVCDSPAIKIIQYLVEHDRNKIKIWDPMGMKNAQKILSHKIEYCTDLYKACSNSSLAVILTDWDHFKNIDASKLKSVMKDLNIYDFRNVIDREYFLQKGFNISSIGYKSHVSRLCSS